MDRWAGGNDAEESGVGRKIAKHLVGSAAELRHWDAQEFAQSGARLPWWSGEDCPIPDLSAVGSLYENGTYRKTDGTSGQAPWLAYASLPPCLPTSLSICLRLPLDGSGMVVKVCGTQQSRRKCHTCHAKQGRCRQVPRQPGETKDVAKCHACHAKYQAVTGDESAPKRATRASPAPQVPRLPRKTKVDVAQARHQSQPSAASARPATQSEGRCHQVPRLPCETKVDGTKRHACHAKYRGVTGD